MSRSFSVETCRHPTHHASYRTFGNTRVHLISTDLWEAITGERLAPAEICDIVNISVPLDSPIATPSQQSFQCVLMARDKNGSRILQRKLEEGSKEERSMIFNGLEKDLKSLIVDPSANFVIQKMCEVLDQRQQQVMLQALLSNVHSIVNHSNGCRVLQKFIETTSPENVDQIYQSLKSIFIETCMSQNGNHIVQRFIEFLPNRVDEIVSMVKPRLIELAFDNCGCRVVQRLFDKYSVDTLSSLVDDVVLKAVDLSKNQYGNYVVQKVLESGKGDLVTKIVERLRGHYYPFSMHKFASNVMEKCIRHAMPREQMMIFTEIIGTEGNWETDRILQMSLDQFGNYVVQKIIKHGNEEQLDAIADTVYENYPDLVGCQYAKHVIVHLKNLGYEFD